MAFEKNREEDSNVEGQIGPNQSMASPVHSSGLRWCEDANQLEDQGGFC